MENKFIHYKLMLFSVTGNLLVSEEIEKEDYRLPLKNLSRGLYFIVLENNEFKSRRS